MAGLPMPTSCYVTCSPTAKMRAHLPTRISNERIHVGGCFFSSRFGKFSFHFQENRSLFLVEKCGNFLQISRKKSLQ